MVRELESITNQWILEQYIVHGTGFVAEQFSFGFNENNRFHKYIESIQEELPEPGLASLIDVISRYVVHSGWNSETDSKVLKMAKKEDWEKLIFTDIPKEIRFDKFNKLEILEKIIHQQIDVSLQPDIKDLIFDILKGNAEKSEF
jgi:hypothetical protein